MPVGDCSKAEPLSFEVGTKVRMGVGPRSSEEVTVALFWVKAGGGLAGLCTGDDWRLRADATGLTCLVPFTVLNPFFA